MGEDQWLELRMRSNKVEMGYHGVCREKDQEEEGRNCLGQKDERLGPTRRLAADRCGLGMPQHQSCRGLLVRDKRVLPESNIINIAHRSTSLNVLRMYSWHFPCLQDLWLIMSIRVLEKSRMINTSAPKGYRKSVWKNPQSPKGGCTCKSRSL